MIRLTQHRQGELRVVFTLDGRLTAETVDDVRGTLTQLQPSLVTLNLSGVTFVDVAGRELLLGLRASGCRLEGASLFIHRLLEED